MTLVSDDTAGRDVGPRIGVWALEEGAFGSPHHPDDPHDASWERIKGQVLLAEELGFDSTLIAQLFISPWGEEYDQGEAWSLAAALAALTERIEIIAAIKPYAYPPAIAAKMALQIEEISKGRFAINFVNGWFVLEARRLGLQFYEHDERYDYGREWITIVRELLAGRPSTFDGRWFRTDGYVPRPASRWRERPRIYAGGESPPARALVADTVDTWFMNGQPIERVAQLIEDVRARPRVGPPVTFGLSAFVIARETDEEADEAHREAWEIGKSDAAEQAWLAAQVDPRVQMFQTYARYPHIGSNGGTAAGLVGSYDTVAERIRAFHELGIELFMLQFQPFEDEMRRFAEHVMPRVRATSVSA
ncbi:LLM class flavin-dependent oxidoreductase [Conexibacter sp. CPCC 206217]|uniref:LLM class flavin-dependent oxidoreductase n=1 Tax=Conexibacter sp. CPCC 206217 TaxID=3064574 RepID=UPI00271669D4|nr:LLM class flavin-dependent oxidoreductase [Conexibacter sp. CPCC 206217]MDO8212041.1 LLM class flavin-dependent oxidoreductase [Conexibacter sp. CPCC 206217]